MAKLKPEIKKLWVDALRSGEWVQTTKHLECEGAYCCLGVLTKLTGNPDDLDQEDELPPLHLAKTWWEDEPPGSVVRDPQVVLRRDLDDWLGRQHTISLSGANDTYSLSFSEIADIIEEQL